MNAVVSMQQVRRAFGLSCAKHPERCVSHNKQVAQMGEDDVSLMDDYARRCIEDTVVVVAGQ